MLGEAAPSWLRTLLAYLIPATRTDGTMEVRTATRAGHAHRLSLCCAELQTAVGGIPAATGERQRVCTRYCEGTAACAAHLAEAGRWGAARRRGGRAPVLRNPCSHTPTVHAGHCCVTPDVSVSPQAPARTAMGSRERRRSHVRPAVVCRARGEVRLASWWARNRPFVLHPAPYAGSVKDRGNGNNDLWRLCCS